MGLWVRAHATVKNMGSMGDSDAEKGGLLSLLNVKRVKKRVNANSLEKE